jgi:hypothetical protein
MKIIKRLVSRFVAFQNSRQYFAGASVVIVPPYSKCRCNDDPTHDLFDQTTTPVGEWEGPIPHPHPLFADKLQIERRRIIRVARCKSCEAVTVASGWDVRDLNKNNHA